jgi:hypothetical protein
MSLQSSVPRAVSEQAKAGTLPWGGRLAPKEAGGLGTRLRLGRRPWEVPDGGLRRPFGARRMLHAHELFLLRPYSCSRY